MPCTHDQFCCTNRIQDEIERKPRLICTLYCACPTIKHVVRTSSVRQSRSACQDSTLLCRPQRIGTRFAGDVTDRTCLFETVSLTTLSLCNGSSRLLLCSSNDVIEYGAVAARLRESMVSVTVRTCHFNYEQNKAS